MSESAPYFYFETDSNSFAYLFQDAEWMHRIAASGKVPEEFDRVRLCRTAMLLYVVSAEALINYSLPKFLPEHLRAYYVKREKDYKTSDKWLLLPLLVHEEGKTFDESSYPWSHFNELLSMRNDYLHPKAKRPAFYRCKRAGVWEPLPWNEVPEAMSVRELQVVYRQTRIPKDPYNLLIVEKDTLSCMTSRSDHEEPCWR